MSTFGENEVRKYLETLGFNVTKIPESSAQQTPDFLVKDETAQYVVEVKDKENPKFINLFNSQNASDKANLEYDNTISGIIREGAKQLNSYEYQGKLFKTLWFFIDTNIFGGSMSTQIGKTLYGLQELEGYKKNRRLFFYLCFRINLHKSKTQRCCLAIFTKGMFTYARLRNCSLQLGTNII